MRRHKTADATQRPTSTAFTLPEVIIAAVLMLLSLSLLLSAFVSSKRSVKLAQTHIAALQITCNEMEKLKTNLYDNINEAAAVTLTNSLIEYQMSRSITTNALNTYKDIKITIAWITPTSLKRRTLTNYMTICNTD